MKNLVDFINENIKDLLEELLHSDGDFKIDASKHSIERYYRAYHKNVTKNDLKMRLLKLKNRLIRLFYIDKEIDENTGVIIIDKSCKPNFVIVCALQNRSGKLYLKNCN